jgi:hypothetical protein
LAPGCGKASRTSPSPSTFASASSEIKAAWDKATAAAGAKDYAVAILTFRHLATRPELTPEQRAEVNAAWTGANAEMLKAVENGDPKATAALEEIRKKWN